MSLANIDTFEWIVLSIQAVCVVAALVFACRATWFARKAQESADKAMRAIR